MYAIGLMSGTSLDGIDAVLMKLSDYQVIGRAHTPYSDGIKNRLNALMGSDSVSLSALYAISHDLSICYADTIQKLLSKKKSLSIAVIGCHGQAVLHKPEEKPPFSVQLVCPYTLSKRTKLPVAYDFRQADMVYGGQGAPLAPIFHHELFSLDDKTAVINLGGIANISYVDDKKAIRGFDTGPANGLMDLWAQCHLNKPFDENGAWALTGDIQDDLLAQFLADPFFKKAQPKSLDKQYFAKYWLDRKLTIRDFRPEDVQRTLLELTVRSSIESLQQVAPNVQTLIVCGGGAKNNALIDAYKREFSSVKTSGAYGYQSQDIEAMMMAWLGLKRLNHERVDLSTVTGSQLTLILGAMVLP